MEKSVLFFDIDGTLLSEKTKVIPESAMGALDKAKRRGTFCLSIRGGRSAAYRRSLADTLLTDICAGAEPIYSSMMRSFWHIHCRKREGGRSLI